MADAQKAPEYVFAGNLTDLLSSNLIQLATTLGVDTTGANPTLLERIHGVLIDRAADLRERPEFAGLYEHIDVPVGANISQTGAIAADSGRALKRARIEGQSDVEQPMPQTLSGQGKSTDAFGARLRSAIDLQMAITSTTGMYSIGHCPSKVAEYRKSWGIASAENSSEEYESDVEANNSDVEKNSSDVEANGLDVEANDAEVKYLPMKVIIEDLRAVQNDFPVPIASGTFTSSFNLQIMRPGCEFNGPIEPGSKSDKDLLKRWLENSSISGYGDVRDLDTKIDPEVRNAREILASEFEVDPELMEQIKQTWAKHFVPSGVRVEPYKIHIYGPGGHFKSHRDTPEKDLVGTFLVGLGDTQWKHEIGNFCIRDKKLKAEPCSWVAFHPDIPHSVSKLYNSYRAVIAFKIFQSGQSHDKFPELEDRMRKILAKARPPYGVLLRHEYCIGTSDLSGFDNFLLSVARIRTDVHVHALPVLIKFWGEYFDEESREKETHWSCYVYPFTESHVDIALGRDVEEAEQHIKWLHGVEDVPFYGLDFKSSVATWKHEVVDGENYTGNESDSMREDSIYLSYAMLVLPIAASK